MGHRIGWAAKQLLLARKVRRNVWHPSAYVVKDPDSEKRVIFHCEFAHHFWTIDNHDLFAYDWEFYDA